MILNKQKKHFSTCILKMCVFCILFISYFKVNGQTDSLKYKLNQKSYWSPGSNKTNIDLVNPIGTVWKYNSKTNRYEEYTVVGTTQYPSGRTASVAEYLAEQNKQNTQNYYRDKSKNAMSSGARGKSSIAEYLKAELNNPLTNKIFGEGAVDFQVSGSAMIKFGGNINVNKDPNKSKRQQRYFVPIFDQQIQFSANGNIGQYVKLGINYDTEAAFEFDNQTNLGWKGKPSGFLKDFQVGNLSLNLPTQLIKPANNLYGISNSMQFGKTTIQTVFSQNKGQSTETVLQGGAQLNEFKFSADNYEQNRHYFLSQFFRNNYDVALQDLPLINSGVLINRVEVWVTNRGANVETPRDILSFMDLGEGAPFRNALSGTGITKPTSNTANTLFSNVENNTKVRKIGSAIDELNAIYSNFEQSLDYEILSNARMLTPTDYTLQNQLGYISLTTPLNNDEVLAVAFEYTYNGERFQVGEFSRENPQQNQNLLFLKMLKSPTTRVALPMWDLMMKNIYNLNTYSLSLEDFKFNIIYADDTSGADYNYLPLQNEPAFNGGKSFLQILGLDKLNRQAESKPDGVFDAIEGLTVNTQYARVMFPVIEPFGKFLRNKFVNNLSYADIYAFSSLYDSTKLIAQQDTRHNKFFLTGSYKSQNGAELFLGTSNLARGSVRVTSNGRPLSEGSDYEVDYVLGKVRILNQSLITGGAEIRATADGQSFFNINQRTLLGTRIEHKFNKNVMLGGTALHMYERPLTSKTNFNEEPLLNTILGADLTFSGQSRFITKMVDKLPFLETKQISNFNGYFEFAKLFAHNHKSQNKERGVSNIDDFENAELPNDYKSVQNWYMASVPQKQTSLIPDPSSIDKLKWLNHHSHLSFFTVDPLFYRDKDMPTNIANRADDILSDPYMRQWDQRDVFINKQFPAGSPTLLNTLDIVFNPFKKGQYNLATDPTIINNNGRFVDPKKSWAGLMRRVDINDFEASNIDYIEVWMLDPFLRNANLEGDIYFNLGNVSEDVLPDRRKSFENGNPTTGDYTNTDKTDLAIVPTSQQINFAFDADPTNLNKQDIGYDGQNNDAERVLYKKYLDDLNSNFGANSNVYKNALNDPSNDDFSHYLSSKYDNENADILGRYDNFQKVEGNSNPTQFSGGQFNGMPQSATSMPNDEDINRDFTMNQSEDYFQYKIHVSKADLVIGQNFVEDISNQTITYRNGTKESVNWYQFKIPVKQFTSKIGNIDDFKSIRFMRMFMHNFNDSAIFRIANINLVRADWRKYGFDLDNPNIPLPQTDNTRFIVSTVNVEENGKRLPIVYVEPPGVKRVRNLASLGVAEENEQALSIQVCNFKPQESRATFKTTQMDVRNYKRMQLFLHAECPQLPTMKDGEATVFLRFGTDLTNNYYEYELPIVFTRGTFSNAKAAGTAEAIWKSEIFMDINFEQLVAHKLGRQINNIPLNQIYTKQVDKGNYSVLGLPDLGNLRVFMIGVRNKTDQVQCFEIWANELRLKDINNTGGYAALANMQTTLADFGSISAAGSIRTIGFGDVDKKLNQRSLTKNMNFDVAGTADLGKFFPIKAGISLPMYIGYSENYIRPKYYPLNPDVELQQYLKLLGNEKARRKIRKESEDYSSLYSFNFTNIKLGAPKSKNMPWNLSNFNLGYSYQNNYNRNQQIEENFMKTSQLILGYAFSRTFKSWEPFKKIKSNHFKIIKDFNINFIPNSFNVQTNFTRKYGEMQARNNNSFKQINPRFYDKNFTNFRTYNLTWQLTKNLNLNYSSTANARIQEPFGKITTSEQKDSIKKQILAFGTLSNYTHNIVSTYKLPLDKIGILNFINLNATYNASYGWTQAPPAFVEIGNTIQNNRTYGLQGSLEFNKLYQKSKWLRTLNMKTPPKRSNKSQKENPDKNKENEEDEEEKEKKPNYLKIGVGNFISMFKNASFNYNTSEGTLLPGFKYTPNNFGQNWGSSMPGIPFLLGDQSNKFRYYLAEKGALNSDARLNTQFTKNFNNNFTGNITIEPLKDVRIVFDFNRQQNTNASSVFKFNGTNFVDQGFTESGTFSISSWFWATHFIKDQKVGEQRPNRVFKSFENNRFSISQRLSSEDARVKIKGLDPNTNFPLGYSKNNQDVLINSFYSAYTGADPGRAKTSLFPSIPLPGWNLNYGGLTKIKFFKEHFSNINIRHGYNGKYTLGGYTQNLKFDPNQVVFVGEDFTSKYQIDNVTITEGFNPLISINVTTKNNWIIGLENRRSRTIRLLAAVFNVTEQRSNEWQMNVGYRVSGLLLPIRRNGKRLYLPNDFKFDFRLSMNDNDIAVRKIDGNSNKYSSGVRTWRINPTISYQATEKFNIAFNYNRLVSSPKVFTMFYTALTDFGLELRYTLN